MFEAEFLAVAPAALFCGFIIGFLICFTGVGGGVLIIPVITFFFDQPPSVAVGTAGIYAALTKVLAGLEHARIGNLNYRLFARVTLFAAPGALLAAAAVNVFLLLRPEADAALQTFLRGAIIVTILFSLLFMRIQPTTDTGGGRMLAAGAFIVGAVIGMTGIGGGALIAPLLLMFGDEAPKRVVGVSILTALVLSALSAAIYAGGGQINYPLALWMTLGSLAATPLGSGMLRHVSETTVRRSIIGLILIAVLLMLAQ